ncbi:MAG: hypothetical protein AMS27_14040 [Bacteroides sp. SM23_62_1]|nr:MAG: hypothetical protein AMS27_14040 [Bacteroides sp. SM23_62_1]
MRFIGFIILFIGIITQVHGQELEWLFGVDGFLDNREYYNTVQIPQTMFGSRMRFEIGGNYDQIHRLRAGLHYIYEFGGEPDAIKPLPTLYYQLDYQSFLFYLGAFPRRDLLDYPLAILTDTLNYYRPNIEGSYLGYRWDWGYQNIFIDWTSRQTDTDFERFMFGFSGRINYSFMFLSHHFLMGHFARPRITPPGFHLRDNGGFDLILGADLSGFTFFDTLTVSAGALVSLDRIRNVYEGYETPAGFLANMLMSYRGIGLQGTYYRGQGHEFLYGDSFYKARGYGRLDLFWQPFKKHNIRGKIEFSVHFIEQTIDYSQQILVSIDIGNTKSLGNNLKSK